MALIKKYMAEETVLYKCLLEVCDYCRSNGYGFKMLKDADDERIFKIELQKDTYISMTVGVAKNIHIRPAPLVVVAFEAAAAHTEVTKKIAKGVRTVGKIVGGGIGAVASIMTAGIGWILGTGITYAGAKIGEVPGVVIEKIDDFITSSSLAKFKDDIAAMVAVFGGRMVEVPDFTDNERAITICNEYISRKGVFIFHIQHAKKSVDFQYNKSVVGKKTTKFFKTINEQDSGLVMELKNSVVEKASIHYDKEAEMEIFFEACSELVGATYQEEKQRQANKDILQTQEELSKELRMRSIGVQ